MSTNKIKLTKYSHGGGCGCKIAPQVLDEILKTNITHNSSQSLIVGNKGKDDAAVYKINETDAIISTTDFFAPIVDDPFVFGKVAAANAISDVYAMGGTPILALAILGWPIDTLPISAAQQVLEGARSICDEADIPLAGGHSIDTQEPIFGLSVNGKVAIKNLKTNNKAQSGDLLLLTQPIGVGIFSTAMKREALTNEDANVLEKQLVKLNSIGALLGEIDGIHAMTDVTGFGLVGHLIEMAEGAELTALLNYENVPKLKGIEKYLKKNTIPDATYRNWKDYREKIKMAPSVNSLEAFQLLPDPQTNGGLLIAVDPHSLKDVQKLLENEGYAAFTSPIGEFKPKQQAVLHIE